ncbi:MAG: ABC transporter permease [Tepidiformaceae bacterium]
MTNYIIRRLLLNLFVIWIVATLVFVTTDLLPSDFVEKQVASNLELVDSSKAVEEARKLLGLDKPLWRRYLVFMTDLARGDLGESYETRKSTWAEMGQRLPTTLEFGGLLVLVSFAVSIPVGIISAVRQNSWIDNLLRGFSILALAMPVFFTAILFILLVLRFDLWTIDIVGSPHLWSDPGGALKLYVIPVLAGGISGGAGIMRLLRSQMLEVMRQDYIRTARAKGLRDRKIWIVHALKNAMLPVLTVMGLTISAIVSGQIILENMFDIDGLGRFLFKRLNLRDFPPFQGTIIMIAFVIVNVNLVVDIMYAWLDPRIRYS